MDLLLIIFVALLLISGSIFRSPKFRGRVGERKVGRTLGKLIDQLHDTAAFHDLTLPTPDGSTQIDHLVISTNGIFVIETKNMSGWIFGGERQRTWTQTIYKKKIKFQNPLRQNYKHVKAVERLLSADPQVIFNVVVFVGDAKFKTAMPINVLKLGGLLPYIRSHKPDLLLAQEVDRYASLVMHTKAEGGVSEKEHIQNLKNSRKNPLCPKCGSPMVLRSARKGRNNGSKFWGCSNFPSCKVTKSMR